MPRIGESITDPRLWIRRTRSQAAGWRRSRLRLAAVGEHFRFVAATDARARLAVLVVLAAAIEKRPNGRARVDVPALDRGPGPVAFVRAEAPRTANDRRTACVRRPEHEVTTARPRAVTEA